MRPARQPMRGRAAARVGGRAPRRCRVSQSRRWAKSSGACWAHTWGASGSVKSPRCLMDPRPLRHACRLPSRPRKTAGHTAQTRRPRASTRRPCGSCPSLCRRAPTRPASCPAEQAASVAQSWANSTHTPRGPLREAPARWPRTRAGQACLSPAVVRSGRHQPTGGAAPPSPSSSSLCSFSSADATTASTSATATDAPANSLPSLVMSSCCRARPAACSISSLRSDAPFTPIICADFTVASITTRSQVLST